MESLNLRPIEQAKIKCARKLFNQLSTSKVKYHDVDSYQTLLNIMGALMDFGFRNLWRISLASTFDFIWHGTVWAPLMEFCPLRCSPLSKGFPARSGAGGGVEPARGVTARDFESRMTANSITPALA